MQLIPDILQKQAELNPDKIAVRDGLTDHTLSYSALNTRAQKCASLMLAKGVTAESRVGVLCRNRIEFFEVLFACSKIGAVMVPLNWRMPAAELAPILEFTEPKLLFTCTQDAGTLKETNTKTPIINFDEDYEALLKEACPHQGRDFWPTDDTWYLLFTSGTTGKPKAVIQTYGMSFANYNNVTQAIGLSAEDISLNFLPLFHTAGVNLYTLPLLYAGASVTFLPGFEVEKVMEQISTGAISIFFAVPAVYQAISLHPAFESLDLSHIRSWGCGGAPLPDALVKKYAVRGALVCNGYGMTETGPTAFMQDEASVTTKMGSVGKIKLLTRARIVDANNTTVPQGEHGEVQMKGPAITPGYWRDEAATKQAFTQDGWLKTGDLAMEDAQGITFVVGRSKEMFISGAENVYPAEVENAYTNHPAVQEIAVKGVTDPQWGEVGKAYIQLAPDTRVSEEELTEFGRSRLAAFKVPKHFSFVEDFPRTAAGKIKKHKLGE